MWTKIDLKSCLAQINATKIFRFSGSSFAFPIGLVVPVLISVLVVVCGFYAKNECVYHDIFPSYLFFNSPPLICLKDFVVDQYAWLWLVWLLSQVSGVRPNHDQKLLIFFRFGSLDTFGETKTPSYRQPNNCLCDPCTMPSSSISRLR